MNLSEVEFAYFFPVVLAVHWLLLPRRAGLQNGLLLIASYIFYATWNPRLLPLVWFATGVDFAIARQLGRTPAPGDEDRGAEADSARRRRRWLLGASLACNLGVLAFFKYSSFFAASLDVLLQGMGLPPSQGALELVLPIGLSFYTLQKLGYIFDVYDGRMPACRSLLTFATFVAYFPQITAGPISRAGFLLPQLEKERRPDPGMFAAGAAALVLGFFLKANVANTLGPNLVDPVFANPEAFSAAAHWVALAGYALQVFSDFAGYSLMAIGCSRWLGIELPQNFNYPFLSTSLPELWRRWHITLNTWLFDYIYAPLVTGQGRLRGHIDLGLAIVFLTSGLWHGSQATFILWGALHAAGMIAHHRWDEFYRGLCRTDRRYVNWRRSGWYTALAWLLTQGFFLLALIPFRSASLGQASLFVRGMVSGSGDLLPPVDTMAKLNLITCALFLAVYHLLELPRLAPVRRRFLALPAPVRGVAYGLAIVYLLVFAPVGASTFIYRQF